MIDPAASLYADIDVVDQALKPFGAPEINEYAGLRWMQRTLEQRREHILGKIEKAEQSTLTVQLRTATGSSAVPAATVARLLNALQQQVHAAGDDVDWPQDLPDDRRDASLLLEVDTVTTGDECWSLVVQRPAGPLSAQPLTDDGERLAFDAAIDHMLDRFVDGDSGDLGVMVTAEGLSLELAVNPATGDGRTVLFDTHTAPAARAVDEDDEAG